MKLDLARITVGSKFTKIKFQNPSFQLTDNHNIC